MFNYIHFIRIVIGYAFNGIRRIPNNMSEKVRVLVWNEYVHEKRDRAVKKIYGSEGIHGAIAAFLRKFPTLEVNTATLNDHKQGLSAKTLKETDVLIWWGHAAHGKVKDDTVDRVQKRVLDGMGLIVLHSGHMSKIFRRLMGTSCGLIWREKGEREFLWVTNPYHPITKGIDSVIELEHTEMYGEYFDIPKPDDILFISNFEGGEVFRSGCTFHRGRGKIFYLRPGHETFPIYKGQDDGSKAILQVIANACHWAKFGGNIEARGVNMCPCENFSLAPIKKYDFESLEAHPDMD
jgi:trehalose utilization protein